MYLPALSIFIFGLILGSFLNVVIHRLPRGESLITPGSHCPHCFHVLTILDLIPILSFLSLKGCCRYCHTRISPRYPFVELLTGLTSLIWWVRLGDHPSGWVYLLLTYVLIVIAFVDLEHYLIPDIFTYSGILGGLIFRWSQGDFLTGFIAGLVGGGFLWLINRIYPQGMGLGDAKLLALAGVFTNWRSVFEVLFLGGLLGTLTFLPLLLFKKITRKTPVPLGPFLVTAFLVVIYR